MPTRPPRAYPQGQRPTPVRRRDPAAAKFYSSSYWQQLRRLVRLAYPICQRCQTAPSQSVHHKDGDITNNAFDIDHPERSNLQALCQRCHDTISGRDHQAKGRA